MSTYFRYDNLEQKEANKIKRSNKQIFKSKNHTY